MSSTLFSAVILPVRGGSSGFVSFVHDDGDMATCSYLADLFEKNGLCGSIAFISSRVGTIGEMSPDGSFDMCLDEEKAATWRAFLAEHSCFDIINHSYAHKAWGFDRANILRETVASGELLRMAFPGQKVISFAYPGFADDGTRSDQYKAAGEAMHGNIICARGLTSGTPNPLRGLNDYYLANNSTYQVEKYTKNDKWIRDSIDHCCSEGGFNIITSHCITPEPTQWALYVTQPYYTDMIETVVAPRVRSGELCCTFMTDAVRYIHETEHTCLSFREAGDAVYMDASSDLDSALYDAPITVKLSLPDDGNDYCVTVISSVGGTTQYHSCGRHEMLFDFVPTLDTVRIKSCS